MKKATALIIIDNLDSDQYTVPEKVEAIVEVVQMPTLNSVKKATMKDAIIYLLALLNDVMPDAEPAEEADHE